MGLICGAGFQPAGAIAGWKPAPQRDSFIVTEAEA